MGKKELRSIFFRAAASIDKTFNEHLNLLWNLNEKQKQTLLNEISRIFDTQTVSETSLIQQDITDMLGGNTQDMLKIISALRAINSQWTPFQDKKEIMIEDLSILNIFPTEEKASKDAKSFMLKYLDLVESRSSQRRRKRTAGRILPNLSSVTTMTDQRIITEPNFDWKMDDADDYQPVVTDKTTVIIIKINTDTEDELTFQCESGDLKIMINKLKATLIESQIFNK